MMTITNKLTKLSIVLCFTRKRIYAYTTITGYTLTDPSGVITANAGDAEDANTKTPFSAQETVLKAHQSEAEG